MGGHRKMELIDYLFKNHFTFMELMGKNISVFVSLLIAWGTIYFNRKINVEQQNYLNKKKAYEEYIKSSQEFITVLIVRISLSAHDYKGEWSEFTKFEDFTKAKNNYDVSANIIELHAPNSIVTKIRELNIMSHADDLYRLKDLNRLNEITKLMREDLKIK